MKICRLAQEHVLKTMHFKTSYFVSYLTIKFCLETILSDWCLCSAQLFDCSRRSIPMVASTYQYHYLILPNLQFISLIAGNCTLFGINEGGTFL